MLAETFQASQATYLDELKTFTAIAGEGVLETATRFDNMAIPLLSANLITERDLAFILRKHLPIFLRSKVFAKMDAQDDKRRIKEQETTTRHEMIAIAQEVEMNIIAKEAEMRNCGEVPPPRSTDTCLYEV